MSRAPLPPLTIGARSIPLAMPPLARRIAFLATWSRLSPPGGDLPLALQVPLEFAALGLAWEAAHAAATTPMEAPPTRLADHGHDLVAYGEAVAAALDGEAVDGASLHRQADHIAWACISSTMPPRPAEVEAAVDFSAAEPVPASSPGSSPPATGSAIPSAGAN